MDRHEVARLAKDLVNGVMCDGFHGYLFNEDEDPNAALRALELIGAPHTASIVKRAFGRFPGGSPPRDRFERQDVLFAVAPRGDEFEADDRDFFAYPEDVFELANVYAASDSAT